MSIMKYHPISSCFVLYNDGKKSFNLIRHKFLHEYIDSALTQTKSSGFDALELSVSSEGVVNTNKGLDICV